MTENKTYKTKYKTFFIITAVIIIAVAVALNVVAGLLEDSFNLKLDLTQTRIYSLSDESQNVLDGLDTNIQVYTLFKTGEEDEVICELLTNYASYSPRVELENIDPTKQPAFTMPFDPQGKGITAGSVIVTNADKSRYRVLGFFDLYQAQYTNAGDIYITGLKAEQSLSSAIHYIETGISPRIAFLSGHGETTTISGLMNMLTAAGYEVTESTVFGTDQALDPAHDTLMIVSPKQDLSDEEYEVIEKFLSNGGKAIFFMDSIIYDTAQNAMRVLKEPLDKFNSLLLLYNIRMNNDMIVGETVSVTYQKKTSLIPTVNEHMITAPMLKANRAPIISDAASLDIPSAPSEIITITPLLLSDRQTYAKTVDKNLTTIDKEQGDKQGPFVLAALSEKGQSKVVVFSTSAIVATDEEFNLSGNRDMIAASVAYLNQREDSIAITPKSLAGCVMQLQSSSQQILLIVLVVGVIPLAVLVIGFIVRTKRKRA